MGCLRMRLCGEGLISMQLRSGWEGGLVGLPRWDRASREGAEVVGPHAHWCWRRGCH